jgi:hypothetical protein
VPEVWFYRFPDEMPNYIPMLCRNEKEARAHVRRQYHLKRIPQGSKFWVEETNEFRDVRGSEADRFADILRKMKCPFRIWGQGEISIILGPAELRFDRDGKFTQMNWVDTGGPSDYHVITRGDNPWP